MPGIVCRRAKGRIVNTLSAGGGGGIYLVSLNKGNFKSILLLFKKLIRISLLLTIMTNPIFFNIFRIVFIKNEKLSNNNNRNVRRPEGKHIHESPEDLFVFFEPRVMDPKTDFKVALNDSRLRPVGVWAVDEELVIRPLRAP